MANPLTGDLSQYDSTLVFGSRDLGSTGALGPMVPRPQSPGQLETLGLMVLRRLLMMARKELVEEVEEE
jgi:hypothetical protein